MAGYGSCAARTDAGGEGLEQQEFVLARFGGWIGDGARVGERRASWVRFLDALGAVDGGQHDGAESSSQQRAAACARAARP
jgi:hypothetical protein